jgi:beta-galactosidase
MILATQYYRPPFPEKRHWASDMEAIRDAGLDAVYLWACWGWIEPEPGRFRFEDYDELIGAAAEAGVKVIVNTIGEIQPFWIHREIPGSELVDDTGRAVASGLRVECNVGVTPGGCTDNPAVREAMGRFLREVGTRYAGAENVIAWDLWNETRWARQAGGYVCMCDHSRQAYHQWLERRYGSLEELSRAWKRRYSNWEDVVPGSKPGTPYTDQMEFQHFLTWRAADHMAFRHRELRAVVPDHHLLVAHGANAASLNVPIDEHEQALSRGNDADFVETLDGYGASVFPVWFNLSNVDFGARVEASRSAARGKIFWVGELQGGSGRGAMEVRDPVRADLQQRWIWSMVGRGAKTINLWCWRDEVFGRESSGFGIVGNDGHAEERVAALARTGDLLRRHREMLDAYGPDRASVGVVFEPRVYQLDWAQHGNASLHATPSMHSYLKALESEQIPYDVIESREVERLNDFRLILMPFPLIVSPELASALVAWVREGGTLLVESEVDAYDEVGFYRPPGERPFAEALGVRSRGRRTIVPAKETPDWVPSFLETIQPEIDPIGFDCRLGEWSGNLRSAMWLEELDAEGASVHAAGVDGPLLISREVGNGRVFALGAFAGLAHSRRRVPDFETFVGRLADEAGARPSLRCEQDDGERVQWRLGRSGEHRLLFVVNDSEGSELTFIADAALWPAATVVEELIGAGATRLEPAGDEVRLTAAVPAGATAMLRWRAAP